MNYNLLLDVSVDLGYRLAMSGAETFRVEESIERILATYGIQSEVFAIPNCVHVSIETPDGKPMTRMRRIGFHGNDLDSVERYNSLSRRICAEKPEPELLRQWLKQTDESRVSYSSAWYMLGNFLGAFGFGILFGGTLLDSLCAGVCSLIVGIVSIQMERYHVNQFFRTIAAAFLMSVPAYAFGVLGIARSADIVIIGALMLLVPGLLFTNAMRDIIFGDTNSGTNRIVQVLLIAAAIALGTGVAWQVADTLWGVPEAAVPLTASFPIQAIACLIGCLGFSVLFNIHGPGAILCSLGGVLCWGIYCLVLHLGWSDLLGYFWASVACAAYAEIMARIRKYPAISYLVVSIFPLIPGAGVYYTMNFAMRGEMTNFANQGTHTIAIAGIMAVGILLVSTTVRFVNVWKSMRKK